MTDTLERFPVRGGRVTFLVERAERGTAAEEIMVPDVGPVRILEDGETLPGAVEDYGAYGQVDIDDATYRRLDTVLGDVEEMATTKDPNFIAPPLLFPTRPFVSFVVDHGERREAGRVERAVTIRQSRCPMTVQRRDGVDVVVAVVGDQVFPLTWLTVVRTVNVDGFTMDYGYRMPPDEAVGVHVVTQLKRTRPLPPPAGSRAAVVRVPPMGPLLRSMPTNTYRGTLSRGVRGELKDRPRSMFDDAGPAETELVVSLDQASERLAYGEKSKTAIQAFLPLASVRCHVSDADTAMREILGLFRTDLVVSIDAAMALAVERGGSTTLTMKDLAGVRYGGSTGLKTDQRNRLRQHAELLQTIGFVWSRAGSKREPLQGKLFTPELTEVTTGKPRLFFLASPLMNAVKNGKGHFVPLELLRVNLKTQEWEYRCGRYLAGRLSENSARLHQASAGGTWKVSVSLDTLMNRAGLGNTDHRRVLGLENYRRRLDTMLGFLVNVGLLADGRVEWCPDMDTATVSVTASANFQRAVTGARPKVFDELAVRPLLPAGQRPKRRRKRRGK
jgi:hypothetical protein